MGFQLDQSAHSIPTLVLASEWSNEIQPQNTSGTPGRHSSLSPWVVTVVGCKVRVASGHLCHYLGRPVNKATMKKSRGEKWEEFLMLFEPLDPAIPKATPLLVLVSYIIQ